MLESKDGLVLVKVTDKNGRTVSRWKRPEAAPASAQGLGAVRVSSPALDAAQGRTEPISPERARLIRQQFSSADCWMIAQHLAAEQPDRMEVTLLENDEGWIHALVRDKETDRYIDIEGVHTDRELAEAWDWNEDWDNISSYADSRWLAGTGEKDPFKGMERYQIDAEEMPSLDEALALMRQEGTI